MPPLYILETKAKKKKNYWYGMRIGRGLPHVDCHFAYDETQRYHSRVAVRPKGTMKNSLWILYNKNILKACYKNKIAPVPQRDKNGKMLCGPLILKKDGDTGHLTKEAKSYEF